MEEAEALCNRIGIMARGSMRCIGATARLKKLYGSGFRMTFSTTAEHHQKAMKFVLNLLQDTEYKILDEFETLVNLEFPYVAGIVSMLFEQMENSKQYGVVDWGISQTSLEDVFLNIVKESDANAYK